MTTNTVEPSPPLPPPGEDVVPPPSPSPDSIPAPPPAPPLEHLGSRGGNAIFKSGPLFISSKGIGWTSWKKRWFILTRTSLVFFRSDPSAVQQKGGEVNLTLGGIDLNNSGSVVVKADKKLLTVLFPDGRDGRAFTLKAETLEDLNEWKTALENALSQAPSASHIMGQNGILSNDQGDGANDSPDVCHLTFNDKVPAKPSVLSTPILLALEDVDGAPSFLEKALRFIEQYGVKVEGILRQAADVDDVEHRIREYEEGKSEFSADEDPHVIADCAKYVLRELPSSPVPASCCNALLEACKTQRGNRVNAMRTAICDTFPEPNRRLLQRILTMMQTIASHKAENRMSSSAVAACMAPLLLRPLLAGDCEIETTFDVGGDGSIQLLQAAAAANHAQAIVITLLDEYEKIFGEGSMSPELYSDSEESGSMSEEASDDDESYEDDENDDAATHDSGEAYTDEDEDEDEDEEEDEDEDDDDDLENASGRTGDGSSLSGDNDLEEDKNSDVVSSESKSPKKADRQNEIRKKLSSKSHRASIRRSKDVERSEISSETQPSETQPAETQPSGDNSPKKNVENMFTSPVICMQKSSTISVASGLSSRRWGRTSARKNLSMESINYTIDEEGEEDVDIRRLQSLKSDLRFKIAEEVEGNAILQARLEHRKKGLFERRLALEKDVERLQNQLQKERDKRTALEAGLKTSQGPLSIPATVDRELKAELVEIAQAEADVTRLEQKFEDLQERLGQRNVQNLNMHDSRSDLRKNSGRHEKMKDKHKDNETSGASHDFERSTSKEAYLDETRSEFDRQNESNKHLSQSQQTDQPRNNNSRSGGIPNHLSKRSKGDGASSNPSALTKLTTRLNFLKERRNQIANELQIMRGSGDKGNRGSHAGEDSHKSKKSSSKSNQDPDGSKRGEGDHAHILDRGRSESSVAFDADRPQGPGGPATTQRTFSR